MRKTITKIWVEKNGSAYRICMLNNQKQKLIYSETHTLQVALTEAYEISDFFGIKITPFRDEHMRIVEPEVRHFKYVNTAKTAYELAKIYQLQNKELNWNKLIHYEWNNLRISNGLSKKKQLLEWIAPYHKDFLISEDLDFVKDWLMNNCVGSWIPVSRGFRFTDERDAVLYTVFFK